MHCFSLACCLATLAAAAAAAADVDMAATTLTAHGIRYYVPHIETARIANPPSRLFSSPLTPFVVVDAPSKDISAAEITSRLAAYAAQDDVYSPYFSSLVYLQTTHSHLSVVGPLTTSRLLLSTAHAASAVLPPGPYFMTAAGAVFQAYRLYDDPQSAFTAGLVQVSADGFAQVGAASFSGQAEAAVPVPSRLYYANTTEPCSRCHSPLYGKRVAVKDIYHVQGARTAAANRAYYALHGPRHASAPAVQRLVEQGAVIVGKTKTSQFANGENPTADWIEVLAPFNPRGDGWQYPSSSSAGSAAGMAAYDWLDCAVGTDTSGSMRFPAAYNGVFAARQSHGGITTRGVVPVSTSLDTLGIFTRSAVAHQTLVQAWYGPDTYQSYSAFPSRILRATNTTLGGFPVAVNASQALYDGFIAKLAGFLHATVVDLEPAVEWSKSGPVPDQGLLEYMYMSYLAIAWYEQVELLQVPFYADWKAYTGRNEKPKIGPKAQASFDYGNNNVSATRYSEALEIKANFTQWWAEAVNPPNRDTCSESIYVYPTGAKGAPTYRDTYLTAPNVVVQWQMSHAAVYAGLPDYSVPIGQVEYLSRLTGMNETLPVSISIGAARGCDWMLGQLMVELEKAGITSPVKTGVVAF